MVDISFTGFLLGLALLLVPFVVMRMLDIRLVRQTVVASVRMVVYMAILGVCMYYLLTWNNVFANVVFALVMIVVSSLVVTVRAGLDIQRGFVPVLAGMFSSAAVLTVYMLLLVIASDAPFSPRGLVAVAGLLAGMSIEAVGKGLSAYYAGLRNHGRLYYYLTGNGATAQEALVYLLRRALTRTVAASLPRMSVMVVGLAPVMMWGMVMCGASIFAAAAAQIVFLVASLCFSVLSVWLSVTVSRRFSIDEYGRLAQKEP